MKNKSLVIIILLLIIGVGVYFVLQKETDINIQSVEEITSGEWKEVAVSEMGYESSLKLMIPLDWSFSGGMDTGGFSGGYILPDNEAISPGRPLVTVYEYSLNGCLDTLSPCARDQRQSLTPEQTFNEINTRLETRGYGEAGLSSVVLKESNLDLLQINVSVYEGVTHLNKKADFYLLQSPKGVTGISFENVSNVFIEDFLSRISIN